MSPASVVYFRVCGNYAASIFEHACEQGCEGIVSKVPTHHNTRLTAGSIAMDTEGSY